MRRISLRPLFWLLLLMAAAWGLRAPFLSRQVWNLDEGVTLTIAEQILHGDVLYRDATDHRGPLVPYLKAAVYAVAGSWNAHAVHLVIALLLGACAFVLWRMARRLGDELTGIAAAFVFTALSFLMLDRTDALSANNGWFIVIFSTSGFGAFAWAIGRPRFVRGLPAGVLFGCSFLCKQPGLLDFGVTWVLLLLLAVETPSQRATYLKFWCGLLAGAAIPVAASVLYFASQGALADFVYYALTYNTAIYVPAVPFFHRLSSMADPFLLVWRGAPVLAILGAGGLAGLLFSLARPLTRKRWHFPLLPWLIVGWAAAGVVSTGLSGRNFSHYSAQAIPGFSLICGWAFARLVEVCRRTKRPLIRPLLPLTVLALVAGFGLDYARRARELQPQDPLVPEIGQLVGAYSTKNERLFVWGYFPEIYFFAHRLPATRFIYTNFVTGLVPWTNLDPLVDTHATRVPGSEAQLEGDWARRPPVVVVDTGASRGYIKYPLHGETELWRRIRDGYAQVSVAHADRLGVRIFRRLHSLTANPLAGNLASNPAIVLSGYRSYQRDEPPRLRVSAPAGARRLELYAGQERVADLNCAPTEPVDVLFFRPREALPGAPFRIVLTSASGPTVSAAFDFDAYARAVAAEQLEGPPLELERFDLRPLSIDTLGGKPVPSPTMPGFWKITAPVELDYVFPAGLRSLDFVHGLEVEAWGHSDGYDLVVEHVGSEGRRTTLLQQRLHAQTSRADREIHRMHLALSPLGPGTLVFKFLAGEKNNANFDWIYLGEMKGHSPGPLLRMGETAVLPTVAVTRGNAPMKENVPGIWAAHTPARIEWPRPAGLKAIAFHFGIEDGAFAKIASHSDGVELAVDVIDRTGKVDTVFTRLIEPFNHPEHRGPQPVVAILPAEASGQRIVVRFGPGPRGDASWDWAWISDVDTRVTGPAIELSDGRRLFPESSQELGGKPSRYLPHDRWGAHAAAELVYRRPANLAKVTFRYGLVEGADRDAQGHEGTDGIEEVVSFQPADGRRIQLFRRFLDPFHNPSDLGEQTATVALPSDKEGQLIFQVTPGPSGINAYDWGYWGRFEGQLAP